MNQCPQSRKKNASFPLKIAKWINLFPLGKLLGFLLGNFPGKQRQRYINPKRKVSTFPLSVFMLDISANTVNNSGLFLQSSSSPNLIGRDKPPRPCSCQLGWHRNGAHILWGEQSKKAKPQKWKYPLHSPSHAKYTTFLCLSIFPSMIILPATAIIWQHPLAYKPESLSHAKVVCPHAM